jgi:hypothetical protein
MRIRAGECRPPHPGAAALVGAQEHSTHGAVHRAEPFAVPKLLARLSAADTVLTRSSTRGYSLVTPCTLQCGPGAHAGEGLVTKEELLAEVDDLIRTMPQDIRYGPDGALWIGRAAALVHEWDADISDALRLAHEDTGPAQHRDREGHGLRLFR